MPIRLRALIFTLILAGAISPALANVPQNNSTDMLMRGAKQWIAKERPDLAENMLKKLILIDPSSEEALYMLGNIELRKGKPDEALNYLRSLEQVAPNSARTRELDLSYRLATSDKASLEKARSLSQAGRISEAQKMLDQLFNGVPPKGEAALDYYRIVGSSPLGYAQAQDGLAALYKETSDTRYRLLQLELQAGYSEHVTAAVHGYEELSGRDVNRKSLRRGWRDALYKLPDNEDKQVAIKHFLSVYPDDKEVAELQQDVAKNIAGLAKFGGQRSEVVAGSAIQSAPTLEVKPLRKKERLARTEKPQKAKEPIKEVQPKEPPPPDPDIMARTDALDALQDGKIEEAEAALMDILKRRPNDPEVVGGLGFVKLKQGKHEEAEAWFTQALQAAKAEKSDTSRWESLINTAVFWKYLRAAEALLKEDRLPEAESTIQQALALKPDNAAGLAVLGNIKVAENDYPEAERIYRRGLEQEGYNVNVLVGLVDLLKRMQRNQDALDLLEHTLSEYPMEWRHDPASKARLLREEANLYVAMHRPSPAIKALEEGVQIDPKNAWERFFLAKLYVSLDMVPLAKRVVQEGVNVDPQNADMRYVQALVLLSVDDYAAALDTLNHIPETELTEPMRNARDRAMIQYATLRAQTKMAQGERKEAIRIMSVAQAQAQAQGNSAAIEQVAEGWFKLGLQEQGLSAMRQLPQPVSLGTQVHYAALLNRAKKDQELAAYLPTLRIPEGMDEDSQKDRETIRDIELSMAGRQFDRLREQGKTEQAQQLADSVLNASQLSKTEYFRAHRTYFFKAALPEDAIASLLQEKEQAPDDSGLRWDLAYAYYQSKQNDKAQQELHELLAMTKPDDVDARLRIAKLQQSVGDVTGAMQNIDDLTSRFPNNMDVLFQAGAMAQSRGEYNKAMDYYEQTKQLAQQGGSNAGGASAEQQEGTNGILLSLLPAERLEHQPKEHLATQLASNTESSQIYRAALAKDTGKELVAANSSTLAEVEQEMARIEERRTAKIETGLDVQYKPATNGTSTYHATEIPVLAKFPIGYEAHASVQVDKVEVDAGNLTPADANAFGTIKAYNYVPPQTLTPKASGASVGVGYEQDAFKVDIGKTGIGFPVSNVVGGVHTGGSIGRMSYSLNLSRRPYTGSQISYAGVRDPITGATWGGVTQTGLSLYMSTDLHDFNVAAMASYGLLRGKNVLNNDRLYLRAAVDTDVYNDGDIALNLGVNANYMSFANNQSYYTFGHGGYYSPKSSLSFGLPIELSGREDMLSFRVRTNLSYSFTQENSAPYYPTDPVLQAMAGNPTYAGGNGGGFGYGLLAEAEYRVAPDLMLGARFSMDRSAYYAPNSLMLYLRYLFKPEKGPVKMPKPVVPYSQY